MNRKIIWLCWGWFLAATFLSIFDQSAAEGQRNAVMAEIGNNWDWEQVGCVAGNLDRVREYYQSLGITTAIRDPYAIDSKTIPDFEAYGRSPDPAVLDKIMMIEIGNALYEFVLPLAGDTPNMRFLKKNGEGVCHIGFRVDDPAAETAKLVTKGVPVLLTGMDGRFTYFGTDKVGGLLIELLKRQKVEGKEKPTVMAKKWEFKHVGLVVTDIDKALEYYRSLGIATFTPGTERIIDSSAIKDFKSYGKTPYPSVKDKVMDIKIGNMTIELVEPMQGDTPNMRFLNSRGEGVSHVCFTVDDIEAEKAQLVANGAEVILTGMGGRFAYFDTGFAGNILLELSQRSAE